MNLEILRHAEMDKGHGRIEERTISVRRGRPPGFAFPFVEQCFCIERVRRDLRGNLMSAETVYGITSQSHKKALPRDLLRQNRRHWTIENGSHYVRDVTFAEDHSRIRKGSGTRIFATLRNLVIGLLRLADVDNIQRGLRLLAFGKKRIVLRMIGIA